MTLAPTDAPRTTTPWSRRVVVTAALCLLLVAAAYVLGANHPRVHTEEAGCYSGPRTVSCQLDDDWTVGVPTDIGWTSVSGVDHEDGRPPCLPASGGSSTVELSWLPVQVDGRSWRQPVWVTCTS